MGLATLCEVGDPRYRFLEGPISWDQAKKECEQFGWQLVEIDSKEKNDAVVEEAKKRKDVGRIWIGLQYSPAHDKWVWISSGDELGFSSWRPGEPNNVNNENCVELFSTVSTPGTWNDLNCGSEDTNRGAICERPKPLVIQSRNKKIDRVCVGNDTCCADNKPCAINEGDCDTDADCKGESKCGRDNCLGDEFDSTDDCCVARDAHPDDGRVTNECFCGEKGDALVPDPFGPERNPGRPDPKNDVDNDTLNENIVNGLETTDGEFPWQAYINIAAGGKVSAGGGVIISPSHVLTAGHVMIDKYTGVRKPKETK